MSIRNNNIMIHHHSKSGYLTEILGNGYLKLYFTPNRTLQPFSTPAFIVHLQSTTSQHWPYYELLLTVIMSENCHHALRKHYYEPGQVYHIQNVHMKYCVPRQVLHGIYTNK